MKALSSVPVMSQVDLSRTISPIVQKEQEVPHYSTEPQRQRYDFVGSRFGKLEGLSFAGYSGFNGRVAYSADKTSLGYIGKSEIKMPFYKTGNNYSMGA